MFKNLPSSFPDNKADLAALAGTSELVNMERDDEVHFISPELMRYFAGMFSLGLQSGELAYTGEMACPHAMHMPNRMILMVENGDVISDMGHLDELYVVAGEPKNDEEIKNLLLGVFTGIIGGNATPMGIFFSYSVIPQ